MSREEQYQLDLEKRIAKHGNQLKKLFLRANNNIMVELNELYAMVAAAEETLQSWFYQASRLETLMGKFEAILLGLGQEEETLLRNGWGEEYKQSLYHHLYFIEQDFQIGVNVPQVNTPMVLSTVERQWEGRHFSKRIRLRTDLLAAAVEDVIQQSAAQGWSVNRTSKEITQRTTESWSNAVRLARTELNRAAAQGQTTAYMANSDIIGEKEFCATLDQRTSSQCRKADGKKFPLDYDTPDNPGKEGEKIPNHPNCRSYWRPVMKYKALEKLERQRAYKLNGQYGYTSAHTYEEWAKEKGISA